MRASSIYFSIHMADASVFFDAAQLAMLRSTIDGGEVCDSLLVKTPFITSHL